MVRLGASLVLACFLGSPSFAGDPTTSASLRGFDEQCRVQRLGMDDKGEHLKWKLPGRSQEQIHQMLGKPDFVVYRMGMFAGVELWSYGYRTRFCIVTVEDGRCSSSSMYDEREFGRPGARPHPLVGIGPAIISELEEE